MHNEYGDMSSGFRPSPRVLTGPSNPGPAYLPMNPSGRDQAGPSTQQRLYSSQTSDPFLSSRNVSFNQPLNSYAIDVNRRGSFHQDNYKQFVVSNPDPRAQNFPSYLPPNTIQRTSLARPDPGYFPSAYNGPNSRPGDISPQPQRVNHFSTGNYDSRLHRNPAQAPQRLEGNSAIRYSSFSGTDYGDIKPSSLLPRNGQPRDTTPRRVSIEAGHSGVYGALQQPMAVGSATNLGREEAPSKSHAGRLPRKDSSNNFFETPTQSVNAPPPPLRQDSIQMRESLNQISQRNNMLRSLSRGNSNNGQVPPPSVHNSQQFLPNRPAHQNAPNHISWEPSKPKREDNFFDEPAPRRPDGGMQGVPPVIIPNGNQPPLNNSFLNGSNLNNSYAKYSNAVPNVYGTANRPSISTNLRQTDSPISGPRPTPRSISPAMPPHSDRRVGGGQEGSRSRSKSILKKREPGERRDPSQRKKSVTINEANNTEMTYKKYLKKMYNSMRTMPAEELLPPAPQPPNPMNYSTLFTRSVSTNEYQRPN